MNIRIGEGYKKSDGTYVHSVFVGEERFDDVKNIKKYKNCSPDTCKHYRQCSFNDGVVRTFDCQKNKNLIIALYNTITGALAAMIFTYLFSVLHLGFFKGMGLLIIALVGLDIICTIIESAVPALRDKRFYSVLKKVEKRNLAKKQREQEEEEVKRASEEFEKMAKSPYYQDVIKAESFAKNLAQLSDEFDFGQSDEKIDKCVKKVNEIIEVLKEDSSGYSRVAFLFEGALEEFYNTLKLYTCFIKADIHEEKNERVLAACVDKFFNYLGDQKIEAIFDKTSIGIQFRSSAEALGKMIDSKGDN